MNDYIKISGLEVYANHGVFPEENKLGQKFVISIKMCLDLSKASENDDLKQSVDYGEICGRVTQFTQNNTFKLIETLAYGITENLLDNYRLLTSVETTVEKPWAPVGLPLDTVSVTVKRRWHTAYVAVGSNMGDKEKYINTAIQSIDHEKGCHVKSISNLIVTEPYGVTDQPDFLNGALSVITYLEPHELLNLLQKLEQEALRVRERHWGPRTLDLDILLFDDKIISDNDLCVPHIDMQNREFVLKPLSEIAPYALHPIFRKTVLQMYSELKGATQ